MNTTDNCAAISQVHCAQRMLRRLPLGRIFVALIWCGSASSVWAINWRHDTPQQDYLDLANEPQFDAVGRITYTGTDTPITAVLIASNWILTAAHGADNGLTPANLTFTINSVPYATQQIILNPNDDLALIRLSTHVLGVTPATIYTGNAELGKQGTFVGQGRANDSATGASIDNGNIFRGANNMIDLFVTTGGSLTATDGADRRMLFADFDAPDGFTDPDDGSAGTPNAGGQIPPNSSGSTSPLTLEGSLNSGDSGGPLYILDGSNWVVAGIGLGVVFENQLYAPGNLAIDNRFSDYGDAMLWTRVSTASTWILSNVPEPSSGLLALMAAGALARLRRRGAQRGELAT